jgi:hypothetical protein
MMSADNSQDLLPTESQEKASSKQDIPDQMTGVCEQLGNLEAASTTISEIQSSVNGCLTI